MNKPLYIIIGLIGCCLHSSTSQTLDVLEGGDAECLQEIDLIILLDGSYSVGTKNFQKVKAWVKTVAKGMHIDHGHVQIGVVQYSHYYNNRPWSRQRYIRTEIELGEYHDMELFDAAVDRIEYQGYKTYTAHALEKTFDEDFVGPNNRYPQAKRALILLTDGKATDSEDLPKAVQRANDEMGVIMYAVGIGNFDEDELLLIANNESGRVFKVAGFDDLNKIVKNLELQLREGCDCDQLGRVNASCDPCTRDCYCKSNVIGGRCDSCAPDHYGLGREDGCLACACNPLGSIDSSCDLETGDCVCNEGIVGRDCNSCAEGSYGFPDCQPCDCNGFATTCDRVTGVCIDCQDGRRGDHCEICPAGHFLDEENQECFPCSCNGNIDVTDPDACDHITGRCEKCLYNTQGENCEKCKKFHYGNASSQSCQTCACSLLGTDPSTCDGDLCVCGDEGACSCLPNVQGSNCDKCEFGSWQMTAGEGCLKCKCSEMGTQPNTTCDHSTGVCSCKENYEGMKCADCADGYGRDEEDEECYDLAGVQRDLEIGMDDPFQFSPDEPDPSPATRTTTTPPPPTTTTTTTAKPKPIRVNPGWSPCVGCGSNTWPSYCRGWTCRRRWPYYQQAPSRRRCYSWNRGCRSSVENSWRATGNQPYNPWQPRNYYGWRQPRYYQGYNHHARAFRPRQYYRQPLRYSLYRSK